MSRGYIPVAVGAVVEVVFRYHKDLQPRQAEIVVVTLRHERVNHGTTRVAPLLKGRFLDTGEVVLFDNSYVTKVILQPKAGPRQQPTNIFAEQLRKHGNYAVETRGSTWVGTLHGLAVLALAKLPYQVDRPINEERLAQLYLRDRAGFLGYKEGFLGFHLIIVNKRRFVAWVSRRWTEILCTVREIDAFRTAMNNESEDDYWRSVELDWRRDMEEDRERSPRIPAGDIGSPEWLAEQEPLMYDDPDEYEPDNFDALERAMVEREVYEQMRY